MGAFYYIDDLTLGNPSRSSAHDAYLNATYNPSGQKIIYKKNKFGLAVFSRFEVSFSQLAKLFLSPNLTSSQRLVVEKENKVLGVAVDHLCYVIEAKEGLTQPFYSLKNPQHHVKVRKQQISDSNKIPIYFLDKLPQGFFARLMDAKKRGKLSLDYDSLASILATSYTLEEDDLHKGNFGFYLVEKEGKPHAVFFKIDHDLMFVDSIMGFQTRRPYHLFHGPGAFGITAEDLISFPNLKYSSNSYWPTKFGYISNPFDNKEYHNFAENQAFSDLGADPEFIRAKWKVFYKHILISSTLIQKTLIDCADYTNPVDRAHIALTTQAMLARLVNLRSVLCSIKEFRDFVVSLDDSTQETILREIIPKDDPLEEEIKHSFLQLATLCKPDNGFEEGDTPLHTAIKLGEYRYEETCRMFGHFINVKNKAGKTPLEVALERISPVNKAGTGDIRTDMRSIMQHLLASGAHKTNAFTQANIEKELILYRFKNPYLDLLKPTTDYASLKNILRDVGEDSTFCLKYKKNLAIDCIKHWMRERKNIPQFQSELQQLKKEVNGKSSEAESAGLKYLRQLRSKLWIIRQLRGLYGQTTTQTEINHLIDNGLNRLKTKATQHNHSFFTSSSNEVEQSGWLKCFV